MKQLDFHTSVDVRHKSIKLWVTEARWVAKAIDVSRHNFSSRSRLKLKTILLTLQTLDTVDRIVADNYKTAKQLDWRLIGS